MMLKQNIALALTGALSYADDVSQLPTGYIYDLETPSDYCCWFYGSP